MNIENPSYPEIIDNLITKMMKESIEEKKEIKKEEMQHILSALPCLLTGYDLFEDKLSTRDDLKEYLEKRFTITDNKSAVESIRQFLFENTQLQFQQFVGFWENEPPFDIAKMDEKSKAYFENCKTFAKQFYPLVKDFGFAAFDFGECIRMAKECYTVGYISEDEYHFMVEDIANRAFRQFENFEDYAISYLCGGTYFMFYTTGGQEEYASQMFQTLFAGVSELFFKNDKLWNSYAWPKGKKYFKQLKEVKKLIEDKNGCLVTDRISIDGCAIGYMVREEPSEGNPDSGWQFYSGDESPEYLKEIDHVSVFALNTICNYDEAIIPLLDAPVGTAYARKENGTFEKVE